MYFETEGIVLKRRKITDSDVFMTLFTLKLGKIQVFVKGGNYPKNALSKGTHPFTLADYSLRGSQKYTLAQVEVKNSFYHFREDLKTLSYGSYFVDFADKSLKEDEHNHALYHLLLDALTALHRDKLEEVKTYFEVRSLKALGVLPELSACTKCGGKENLTYFSIPEGGVVCTECHQSTRRGEKIHPAMIQLMRFILRASLEEYLKKEINGLLLDKMDIFINDYMAYHLDLAPLKTKKFLKIYE